jgi:hypothetical protein
VRWREVEQGVCPDANLLSESSPYPHQNMFSIPPLLRCNSRIASSFLALPIVMQRRGGEDLRIPDIGMTFLEPSLLKRGSDAIERFHNAL